ACEPDPQCGSGSCCAGSLWLRGLRVCTPLGQEGDECHPFSHKEALIPLIISWAVTPRLSRCSPHVPFLGKCQHHSCPCLPNLLRSRVLDSRYRCSVDFKNIHF
ncbi:PROK1 protein, partial [Machaerirhynchus nigripectus]|nr:PROK1 protein [Machaerirhynchus nigripectus]